jgi:hypothetical protein
VKNRTGSLSKRALKIYQSFLRNTMPYSIDINKKCPMQAYGIHFHGVEDRARTGGLQGHNLAL